MLWNIPVACNRATAYFVIFSPLIGEQTRYGPAGGVPGSADSR